VSLARRNAERAQWPQGWWRRALKVPSPNWGERPIGMPVSLAVVHSISLPPGRYGGRCVEQLFTNQLDCHTHSYFERLKGLKVSAHFFIRRHGGVLQFVGVHGRAWHAGASVWRGQANCNDYAVGIELEGLEGERFSAAQYRALVQLLKSLAHTLPSLHEVTGHEHVAPGRKRDPGPGFDWQRLANGLRGTGISVQPWVR
jgi:AmpD protein